MRKGWTGVAIQIAMIAGLAAHARAQAPAMQIAPDLTFPTTAEAPSAVTKPRMALMKPDAILINTAHGRLIDEGALVKALAQGAIGGAGLDVFAYEPLPTDSPLLRLDNVVLTPHVAGPAPETARDLAARELADALRRSVGP